MRFAARRTGLVLAAAVVALASGCGDDDGDGAGPPPAASPTSRTAPASPPATEEEAEPTTVTARLVDYQIELSETPASPGRYTFLVEHGGGAPHALAIEGPGVDESTDTLQSGQSEDLTVTLEPGTYQLWCPVGNHRGMGMELTVDVS
jgi:plastocyanin